MKRIILPGLRSLAIVSLVVFFSSNIYSVSFIKNIFKQAIPLSDEKMIEAAIIQSDVNCLLELVKPGVDKEDLKFYIALAQNNMGRKPKSSVEGKVVGGVKIALSMALMYKTIDYFRTEYTSFSNKSDIITRYKSIHNILMDIACLSGFISSSNMFSRGLDNITPSSNYKKQLLILLYLQSLNK